MRAVLATILALMGVAPANAAIITRAYALTASDFQNFSGTPSPITALSATFPRLGVGGALNGGNTLLNRTDDFYFTFDASAAGPTRAMLGFTAAGAATPFIATNAVVTPVAVAAVVPEAATWAMFTVGLGLVGGAMRRRQRTNVRFV